MFECGPSLSLCLRWAINRLHALISQQAGFKGHPGCTESPLNTQKLTLSPTHTHTTFPLFSSANSYTQFQTQGLRFYLFHSLKPSEEPTDCWSLFLPSLIFCSLYLVSWVGPGQCSTSSSSCSEYDFISTISRADTCGESHSARAAGRANRERSETRRKKKCVVLGNVPA